MSDYGIKISIAGVDVKTATDRQLILTSKFPFLKAFAQGVVTFNVTGNGQYQHTLTHSLGYHPAFVHYNITDGLGSSDRQLGGYAADGPGTHISLESYVSTTILKLAFNATGLSGVFPFTVYIYYYLFYDQLS